MRLNPLPMLAGTLALLVAPLAVAQPPDLGACCVDGVCHVDDAADCESDGGLYLGEGTNCGGVSCECEEEFADSQVFPGDGAGSGPELSYTDNGDGTVTDNNTGLMWEVKTGAPPISFPSTPSCMDDLHDVDSLCDWSDATGAWIDAVNAEGGTGYAGYSDWRLPNVRELQSIVDYGVFGPAIGPSFAGETWPWRYWSATTTALQSLNAWQLNFGEGSVRREAKTKHWFVRAVRGGP